MIDLITETSLNRIISHRANYDTGAISGYRNNISHKQGNRNNKIIIKELRDSGYQVTMVTGFWQEQGDDAPSIERSIFAFDKDGIGGLKEKLIELGQRFNQESILFRPANSGAHLVRTSGNNVGKETAPAKKTHYGIKNGPAWTNVKHKSFVDIIDVPDDFYQ